MDIKLEDLIPADANYTLANGKEYTCRKFDLVDNVWLEKEFGVGDALQNTLRDPMQMMRVAFHQLPLDQQREFSAIEIEETDEDTGALIKKAIGGWRRFAKDIGGPADIRAITDAIVKAMLGSNPMMDKEAKAAVKSQANAKKKPLAGVTSST